MASMRTIDSQNVEEAKPNPNPQIINDQTPKISSYERSREERIKANLERMQKLGLVDLSLKLKSYTSPPKRTPKNTPSSAKRLSPLQPAEPLRRSSRLTNVTPVSYSEAALTKRGGLLENEDLMIEEGSKPEAYTEEHEKLLGNTEKCWNLFVDGYGKDGKRIYDQVKGKTCHQCRQKTLGHRTYCSKCKKVQGQFCGDCLYMRYGEHVLEAIENPDWICPVCRGICNCSLCRQAKGWAPTGPLYKKISGLGYKSVAHYLIQTRRPQNVVARCLVTVNEVSAKRSLPFTEMETLSKRSPQINNEQAVLSMRQYEDKVHDELKTNEGKQLPKNRNFATDTQIENSMIILCCEAKSVNMEAAEVNHDHFELPKPIFEHKNEPEFKVEEEEKLQSKDKEDDTSKIALEISPKLIREQGLAFQPSPDSIGARLRDRSLKINGQGNAGWASMNEKDPDVKQSVNNKFFDQEEGKEKEMHVEDDKHFNSIIILESSPKLKKKSARATEPNIDSIGGRLRQRRRMSKGYDDNLP